PSAPALDFSTCGRSPGWRAIATPPSALCRPPVLDAECDLQSGTAWATRVARDCQRRGRRPRMADPKGFASLKAYLESLQVANHASFAARADSRVAHEDAFADMKAHIERLYANTEATHSFMDETGAIFDCIPIEQQPALRGSREGVPKAPNLPGHE